MANTSLKHLVFCSAFWLGRITSIRLWLGLTRKEFGILHGAINCDGWLKNEYYKHHAQNGFFIIETKHVEILLDSCNYLYSRKGWVALLQFQDMWLNS